MKIFIKKFLKQFVLAFAMLYALNLLLVNLDVFIPINAITVAVTTFLGPFGAVSLVILSYMI